MALTKALGGAGGSGITQLTGDVTAGPGSGSQAATIANGAVDIAHLSATGTPSSTTFLRGDNTWGTPAGAGPTARAYWMVVVDRIQTAGGNARIGELQLRATSGGSNIATGGTPIFIDQASSSGDNSAAAAFDGNSATAWASSGATLPSGVGYQLSSASVVNEIVITARNDSFGPGGAPIVLRVLSSADGVNCALEWSCLSPATWTAGLSRTFTRP
jgi:hypothetical protein